MPKVDRSLPPWLVTARSASGYMLETPSIRWYSSRTSVRGSENPRGADNQQERPVEATSPQESSETIRQTS